MGPKDADGMANSVDPDQTPSVGAVWSGSTLFDQTCLSENLEKIPKYSDSQKFAVVILKFQQCGSTTE